MLLEGLLNRGTMPVLEQVTRFTEARHEVLANNISNFDTVGYKAKDLPMDEFVQSLEKAVKQRDTGGAGALLRMKNSRHLDFSKGSDLSGQAVEVSDSNILFHDDNNRFVEKQMSEMSKNALLHNVATELLNQQYNLLQTAISGRL